MTNTTPLPASFALKYGICETTRRRPGGRTDRGGSRMAAPSQGPPTLRCDEWANENGKRLPRKNEGPPPSFPGAESLRVTFANSLSLRLRVKTACPSPARVKQKSQVEIAHGQSGRQECKSPQTHFSANRRVVALVGFDHILSRVCIRST